MAQHCSYKSHSEAMAYYRAEKDLGNVKLVRK